MPTDIEIIKQRLQGQAETYGLAASAFDALDSFSNFALLFDKAADDGAAATTTAETYTGRVFPVKSKIVAVYYLATTGGITADATNNATITISKRDSAAANKLTVASATTNVAFGNVTQGAAKALTVNTSNFIVDALSSLTFEIAKGGTGVVVRAGSFLVICARV